MAAICPELSALDPDEFHFNQWEWLPIYLVSFPKRPAFIGSYVSSQPQISFR